ncbi:MAG: transcription elongation factor GreA [Armatimonadota bacterium]
MAAVHLTRAGYQRLHAELRELIEVRRPQVMSDLVQAREYGDLRENAEYEVAKRDQGVIEGRIHELEEMLSSVEIIKVPAEVNEVMLGARVVVENLDFNLRSEYVMVGEQESHLADEHLSVESPLGRALVGSVVGDVVTFDAPAGVRRFKVLHIERAFTDDDDE